MQDHEIKTPTLDELLEASAATPEFKAAVKETSANGRATDRVVFGTGNPPVKVLRVVSQLLENHPDLAIDRVEVQATSGCSDYRGELTVNGTQRFKFVWDCAWKAEQVGWKDYFGMPDQIRAARTFGYRCFQRFEEITK